MKGSEFGICVDTPVNHVAAANFTASNQAPNPNDETENPTLLIP
jgi:hypothetical protein